MNKDYNELDSQEDIKSISVKDIGEDSVSSVRRKYQKGKKDANINYGAVIEHKIEKSEDIPNLVQKEEIITYQKEITKKIEDDYSSNEGESSLVKKSKEERIIPVKNLKNDFESKNEEIVVEHSNIEKEIESKEKEIMKDLEKHLDLKDILLSSNKDSKNLNQNEVKEATYIKKTIEIISKTSADGKLIDDGNKDINSQNKNEVTTFTKTSVVNQLNESPKFQVSEDINTSENFTNNEEKTSKITIIKKENSSEVLVNKDEKKEEVIEEKKEEKEILPQKEIFSETKVVETTEKTEENVERELPKPKPEIEFKKDTTITTTTTTNINTETIEPKPQPKVSKLSEIISRKRQRQAQTQAQIKNQIINKGRQTPSELLVRGRQTPNLMINTGRQTQYHMDNTGRQTPNQYLFSQKTTTTTTTVKDNPITSIVNKKNKDIFGSSSTLYTSSRNKNIISSLPQISESREKKRELSSNQTTSVLTNIKRIEPFNVKNERYDFNKVTITNESHLRNEKSTPALRGGVTKSIVEIRKPLYTITQSPEKLNNLSTITISETGKKPKRQYVLNNRNTDVIKHRNRIRLIYTNNPNTEFVNTDFNLRSKVVKNFSKEHNNSAYLPNTVYHEINETRKHDKKEVHVSPRKLWVIKTERKPLKYTYATISNTDQPLFRNSVQTTTSTLTESRNALIRGRNYNPEPYNTGTYKFEKSNYLTSLNNTSKNLYTKTKYEPISNRSNYETNTNTTVRTRISELRNTRNRNKEINIPLTAGNSKTNLFKTIETRVTNRNNRNERRFNRAVTDLGNKNNLNSNKIISIKTSKVITDSDTNNNKGINNADYNIINQQKITKIVYEGSSSSVQNSGADALSLRLGNNDDNKFGLIKKQESSTITTKEITIESSDGSGTQFKESRFVRMLKKGE